MIQERYTARHPQSMHHATVLAAYYFRTRS